MLTRLAPDAADRCLCCMTKAACTSRLKHHLPPHCRNTALMKLAALCLVATAVMPGEVPSTTGPNQSGLACEYGMMTIVNIKS